MPLLRLIEECSEVQHVLCKILRFGWVNEEGVRYPDKKKALLTEIQDLKNAIDSVEKYIEFIEV
jgi:hypothetical protein